MPISGLPGLPLSNISISQRPAAGGGRAPVADSGQQQAGSQATPRINQDSVELSPGSAQRAVEPVSRQREIFSRQSTEDDPLTYRAQRALQAFADNSPSPSQQLGIELAGIDTYV